MVFQRMREYFSLRENIRNQERNGSGGHETTVTVTSMVHVLNDTRKSDHASNAQAIQLAGGRIDCRYTFMYVLLYSSVEEE